MLYGKELAGEDHFWTSTLNWGYNFVDANHQEHSVLLESNLQQDKFALYGRYEWVQKGAEELGFEEGFFGHDALFGVHAFTLGANRQLFELGEVNTHLGAQLSLFRGDEALHPYYGEIPISGQVYLRIFPTVMVP